MTGLKRIGIIGGGQLGKMMILEAKKMGFYVTVLDPSKNCPASSVCDRLIAAPFDNADAINELADQSDVITYEFEHIGAGALLDIETAGKEVYPTVVSLLVIQDKLAQKKKLRDAGIPVPDFIEINKADDVYAAVGKFEFPLMLKTCREGYDGKGNKLITSAEEINAAYDTLGADGRRLMAERFANYEKEISVLVCRGINGESVVYPVAENTHVNSILDRTAVPADITSKAAETAMRLASEVMEVFRGVGMFCVEMFLLKDDVILINEVAPRPHNSGHYSIEACVTSQFENHIRAIAGLPLGDAGLLRPAVMRNLLGAPGCEGLAEVRGMKEALNVHGVKLHLYGKEYSKPHRKMGHITAIGATAEEAGKRADRAFNAVVVTAERTGE